MNDCDHKWRRVPGIGVVCKHCGADPLDDAVSRIESELKSAREYLEENDVAGEWLDADGESLKDGESAEAYYASLAEMETWEKALAIVQSSRVTADVV